MRYEVEPDGTLRILEDDKPAPEPRKPSGPREPRGTGVSFMAVAHQRPEVFVFGQVADPVSDGFLLAARPFGQQPQRGQGPSFRPRDLEDGRTTTDGQKP